MNITVNYFHDIIYENKMPSFHEFKLKVYFKRGVFPVEMLIKIYVFLTQLKKYPKKVMIGHALVPMFKMLLHEHERMVNHHMAIVKLYNFSQAQNFRNYWENKRKKPYNPEKVYKQKLRVKHYPCKCDNESSKFIIGEYNSKNLHEDEISYNSYEYECENYISDEDEMYKEHECYADSSDESY